MGEMHEISAKIGALDERTSALQSQLKECKEEFNKGFESISLRLDLIAKLAPLVEDIKKDMDEDIRPTCDDYQRKKRYAIGGIGAITLIWGGMIEGVKGAAKILGIGQ